MNPLVADLVRKSLERSELAHLFTEPSKHNPTPLWNLYILDEVASCNSLGLHG
jgi:hypothetical protein